MIAAFEYALPLNQPLRLAHGELTERRGLLLKFQQNGQISWGEAAPLPGFSQESLQQVKQALRLWLEQKLSFEQLPPSLQFAIDMGQNPLAQAKPVQMAHLITSSPDPAFTQQNAAENGVIKVKVGQLPVADDIERLAQLKQAFPKALWRLDANRLWSLDQALAFAKGVGDMQSIAFVEEPCATLGETQAFARQSGWPVALDETLQQPGYLPESFPGLAALVCKPTLVGSLQKAKSLADFAANHHLDFILSGSFESSLTNSYLNALANLWAPQGTHGLDTLSRLGADLIRPRGGEKSIPLLLEDQLECLWQV